MERAPFIRARQPTHLVQIALGLPQTAHLVLASLAHEPRMTWADFKLMTYVTRWRHLLERPVYSDRILVMDQGPLYALVRLKAKDLGLTSQRRFEEWWRAQLAQWTRHIETVVWLDAPDEVLASRINQRDQSHWVKGEAPEVSESFIRRYRELFLDVIEYMQEMGDGPVIHRFDTNAMTADEISQRVAEALLG